MQTRSASQEAKVFVRNRLESEREHLRRIRSTFDACGVCGQGHRSQDHGLGPRCPECGRCLG